MFKKRVFSITLCVIIFLIFFWYPCLAYDGQSTHSNLTDITVEIFNLTSQSKILQSEKYWIKKGSMDEDNGLRSINHFYDPIYNRTWKIGGLESLVAEVTSKIWVNDQLRQASYDPAFLATIQFQTKSCLESTANQTYNRAIYEYIKGNKKEAFYALGHTLHLLQDLTSVPHTRADVHIVGNDQSSFEIMSAYKTKDDFINIFNKLKSYSAIKRSTIDDYFYNVALYTNNHFYSDDTIVSYEYSKPEIFQKSAVDLTSGSDKYYILGWDAETQNVYKLAKQIGRDWKTSDLLNLYEIKDPLVFEDYWSRLSKKAVLEGAGLVDLFFKDVERKKNDQQFMAMMEQKQGVKVFENVIGDVKQLGTYLASLFNKHPEDIIIQPPNTSISTTATTALATPTTKLIATAFPTTTSGVFKTTTTKKITTTTTTKKPTTTTTKKPTTTTTKKPTTTTTKKPSSSGGGGIVLTAKCNTMTNGVEINQVNKKVILNEIAWMGSTNNFSDEWIELKNISNERVDISLWEIINGNQSIKIVIPEGVFLNPQEMYLLERTDDNTVLHVKKDLIYVGAIRNENEEIKLFDKNCIVMDSVVSGSKWPAGDSESKRTMERSIDFSWYTSSANCINGICGTPKSENSPYLDIYNNINTTVTTTTTTQPVDIITTTTTTLPTTTTTTVPIEIGELKKLVFSEIKIAGENAEDEFVELYNPSDEDISLTGWSIKYKTSEQNNLVSDEFFLDKIIPANGYFLIVNKQLDNYKGEVNSDTTFNSVSYSLWDHQALILYDNFNREVDRVGWGEERIVSSDCETNCLPNIEDGKSFERKANENSTVETMENGIDKIAGNSYDINDNVNDFVIRINPDPQNSQSLIEPREETEEPNNIGDGFVIKNFNVYYLNSQKERAFIEFDIDQYPFWNVSEENDDKWRAMVFYLNSSGQQDEFLSRERAVNNIGYAGWQASGKDNQVLLINYNVCKGGSNTKFGQTFMSSLILPYTDNTLDTSFVCDEQRVGDFYGAPNSIAYNYNLNKNHIKIEIKGVLGPNYQRIDNVKDLFKEGDYITIGFYKGGQDYSNLFLDTASLIFRDNTQRFIDIDNGKIVETPKNLSVTYDEVNYKYDLIWDKMNDEQGVNYVVCMSDINYNFNGNYCYSNDILWNGEKWSKSFELGSVPYESGKVYFVVRAVNSEYEIQSDFSNVVESDVYEMPKRIDEYISNVNWTIKNDRMYVEFDLDRIGKFRLPGNADHYIHELITAWDFRENETLNTNPNPKAYLSTGTISDSSCLSNNNNSDLRLFSYNNAMTLGHKEILIKYLSHPLLKDKYLYNSDGLTTEDLNKLVKSESNPDGILNSLSEMVLMLNYGIRYRPYCDYWAYDGNFGSFTMDTNQPPNQIKYNFQFSETPN